MFKVWKIGCKPFDLKEFEKETGMNIYDYLKYSDEHNFVAIGWKRLGNLKNYNNFNEIVAKMKVDGGKYNKTSEQIFDFANNIKEGHIILHYEHNFKIHNVGKVVPWEDGSIYKYVIDNNLKGFARHRIKIIQLFDGRSFKADFSKWQDTIHEFKEEDLNLIQDKELRDFLYKELLNKDKADSSDDNKAGKNNFQNCRNLIFYGPPGTGKTFKTKARAVGIIHN